ncbi:hypothetical protein NUW58_g3007 [Xylaria curta]|uniref:Uncharacterized protein n=1 Tax=Xylaria curta TaxID=42375 RepID=A0ACC1PFN1_9PEZI|nr:hypothetical protein NUW58_g3007 [Xylaria curta]
MIIPLSIALTIVQGAFRIYRAPGSVAFLSCGSALQPILPKSQCWCIDEDNGRFVLQIRRPQYWRIEVPVADPADAHRAVLLRDVFDKILLFEKTACPFQRSFTVELPDPETPVKKKAWTAEGKNLISSPFESDLSPPAHMPVAIRRGRRVTSASRRASLSSNMSTSDSEVGGDVRPGAKDQSSGEGRNAQSPSRQACSHASISDRAGKIIDQTAVNPPNEERTVTRGLTASPSVFISPSTGPQAPQSPGSLILVSSLPGTNMMLAESLVSSRELPSLSLSSGRLSAEDGDANVVENLDCTEEHKENTDTHDLRAKDNLAETSHGARKGQEPMGVVKKLTANRPDTMIAETGQQTLLSGHKGSILPEPEESNSVDDLAPFEGSGGVVPVNLARKRMTRMLAGRSFTAPPQPSPAVSSRSDANEQVAARRESPPQPPQSLTAVQSPSTSTDSFHSVQSWRSAFTPPLASPESKDFSSEAENILPEPSLSSTYSSDHITTPKNAINAIPGPPSPSSYGSTEPTPRPTRFITEQKSQEPLGSESAPRATQLPTFEGKIRVHRRSHASSLSISRQALSPLPPPANFFTPPPRQTPQIQTSQSRLAAVRGLPAAIIHKTMEILLGPPSYLVKLMLKVAAKIVAGEWRGLVFGFGEAGEQIPGAVGLLFGRRI